MEEADDKYKTSEVLFEVIDKENIRYSIYNLKFPFGTPC